MAEHGNEHSFKLVIPLDISKVDDAGEAVVKVLVKDSIGRIQSQQVKIGNKKTTKASFEFSEHPGTVHVLVGPSTASDEELSKLQTLNFSISKSLWDLKKPQLELKPTEISNYFWHWWRRWCQIFTIRGRVVCADGSPVPGADVSAFDVDRFLFWSNTQQVATATTGSDGSFEIKFRWCCGWWPWWWWRNRIWQIDPRILEKITPHLDGPLSEVAITRSNQPDLGAIKELLQDADLDVDLDRYLDPTDLSDIERFRKPLLQKLPYVPELKELRLWPWHPWHPWWDCNPDIIFKVTQNCNGANAVIVEETIDDTRWNISTTYDVNLVANEEACCIQGCNNEPCPEGECLVVDRVCNVPIQAIGGNLGAAATPEGYYRPSSSVSPVYITPGTYAYNADRPFANTTKIFKTGSFLNVDYYELEHDGGSGWLPLPAGAASSFFRGYWDANSLSFGSEPFPFVTISGHSVVETREHHEIVSGLTWNMPGADRYWTSAHYNLLVPLDSTKFIDGSYRFRVIGWDINAGGNLENRRILPICGSDASNEFVLNFDNRLNPEPGHPASHNCGSVHSCTSEPDTHFINVSIDGNTVAPCDTANANSSLLEIVFEANDPDGHLAYYTLYATYGLNQSVNLLNRPGSVLSMVSVGQQGPAYGQALAQGAVAPVWNGGTMKLQVPVSEAFPVPCCYQLELRAYKRTIAGCNGNYPHRNRSEYSIGVGVCPGTD